ncbi:MAG TPA: hypothetical protein VH661_06610 [Candidatus Dormibacteraeota bacterium]|nr:hypothetical protein [Candidatus Dormibacteraeota bacterium]
MPRSVFSAGALIALAAGLALSGCGGSSAPTPTPTAAVGNNSSSFCTQAGQVDTAIQGLGSAVAQATPGTTPDLNTLKQVIATGATGLDSLDSQAPSDIASAFHTLRMAYDQANTAAQSATSIDQLSTIFASFGTPAVASAASEITAYIVTKCGFTPGASTAPTPTPT